MNLILRFLVYCAKFENNASGILFSIERQIARRKQIRLSTVAEVEECSFLVASSEDQLF